jgi:shikimate dehydrogenase
MHNAVFQKMNLPYLYLPFRVAPRELASFLKKVRLWKLKGLNVTIPHKEAVLRCLDRISPEARAIGAVNTIVLKNGKLIGYNTDAGGYLRSLKEEAGFDPRGKTVLILGAGGAARAVFHALKRAGAKKIILSNRTLSRAANLARDVIPLKTQELKKVFPSLDLLINATSIGLKGTRFKNLPLSLLPKKAVVSDLVYRPILTPLLREAKKRGLKIHPGIGMLLYQGAESFRLWTGRTPDLKAMKKALLDALKRNR